MRSLRSGLAFGAGIVVGIGLIEWSRHRSRAAAIAARGPVTQATVPDQPADLPLGEPGRNLDERLDEALLESFPASDPVSMHIE